MIINSWEDCQALQRDLNTIAQWCLENGMSLNVTKCQVLSFTNRREKILYDYTINGTSLERTSSATYLGVIFDEKLSFSKHVENIVKKANSTMYFIRRVFSKSTPEIKEKVYYALVRSKLEYAATSWDPHSKSQIESLEMVQHLAARFVMNDFSLTSSVTSMITNLNWNLLSQRRQFARLKNFYLVYNEVGGWVDLVEFLKPPGRTGRSDRPHLVRSNIPRTDVAKYSFIIRTAKEWNSLPDDIFSPPLSFGAFKGRLRNHLLN